MAKKKTTKKKSTTKKTAKKKATETPSALEKEMSQEQVEEMDEAQKVIQATEGPLKGMLVDYVGKVLQPESGQVTVEMIVHTLASEFPEFLFVVAKENWLRGYEQALVDIENVEKEKVKTFQEQTA